MKAQLSNQQCITFDARLLCDVTKSIVGCAFSLQAVTWG